MNIPAHNQDLIAALEQARTEDGISQTKLAKLLNVTPGPLNKYLNGKYNGDVAEIERKAEEYLATRQNTRRIKSEIFETAVTRSVANAITIARVTGDKDANVSIIHGPAGCGKTKAVEHYCAQNPLAVMGTLNDRHRDGRGVSRTIMTALNLKPKSNVSHWKFLVDKFSGSKRPIIIDNAQRLNTSGMAWINDFQDETRCPVILVGNPEIIELIKTNDQSLSRFGFAEHVSLNPKELSDIAHRVAAQYFDDAEEVRDLTALIAKGQGGLRSVKKQCLLAQALKDNGIPDPRKAFQAAHSKLIRDYTLPA